MIANDRSARKPELDLPDKYKVADTQGRRAKADIGFAVKIYEGRDIHIAAIAGFLRGA